MYKKLTYKKKGLEYFELLDKQGHSSARICLNQGGNLEELIVNDIQVIETMSPLAYEDVYPSSILFPFVNRVKGGVYKFKNKHYQLNCNENGRNNAIHGLVYNQKFEVENSEMTSDFGSVTLRYKSDGKSQGFPFKYVLYLTYKLSNTGLLVTVKIINKDSNSFPFTVGWHPYFLSSDLYNSYLKFKSSKKIQLDDQLIAIGLLNIEGDASFHVENKKLDDGYVLDGNSIEFSAPNYNMIIQFSSQENFLQLYTPKKQNTIAIEPMTGVSDSLNNKIGLQILNPGKEYQVSWSIEIEKKSN